MLCRDSFTCVSHLHVKTNALFTRRFRQFPKQGHNETAPANNTMCLQNRRSAVPRVNVISRRDSCERPARPSFPVLFGCSPKSQISFGRFDNISGRRSIEWASVHWLRMTVECTGLSSWPLYREAERHKIISRARDLVEISQHNPHSYLFSNESRHLSKPPSMKK